MSERTWADEVFANDGRWVRTLIEEEIVTRNDRIAALESALMGLIDRIVYSSDMDVCDCAEVRKAKEVLKSDGGRSNEP
jgi:hypothetical protein